METSLPRAGWSKSRIPRINSSVQKERPKFNSNNSTKFNLALYTRKNENDRNPYKQNAKLARHSTTFRMRKASTKENIGSQRTRIPGVSATRDTQNKKNRDKVYKAKWNIEDDWNRK